MDPRQINKQFQRIGDISNNLGISPRTIRYYEELGLIVPKRTNGGFREYSSPEIKKLQSVLRLKNLGLSLEEIRKIVKMRRSIVGKKSIEKILQNLGAKRESFQKMIDEYKVGLTEIEGLIDFIKHSMECTEEIGLAKCEKCLAAQNKEIPPLIRVIL